MSSDTLSRVSGQTEQQRGKSEATERHLPQPEDEVIEILSDEEVEILNGVSHVNTPSATRVDTNSPSISGGTQNSVATAEYHDDDNDDDDVQITHVNNISQEPGHAIGRIRQRSESLGNERNARRRLDELEDVELVNEIPAARQRHRSQIPNLRRRQEGFLRHLGEQIEGEIIHTPRGDFQTGDLPTILGEIRRISQRPVRRHLPERSARNLRRRRQTGGRFATDLEQFELPMHLFGTMFFHDNFPSRVDDTIENSIMERIERDNDNAVDSRLATENIFNKKSLDEKKDIINTEVVGYINDINSSSNTCCELCGIVLGEGIPKDFLPDVRYDEDYEAFAKEYRVKAPWFCIRICSESDFALSKRVFISKCGHLYCGRCVKNIGNRPARLKGQNTKLTISNPHIFAPRKCPALECTRQFTAKSFIELYF